MLDPAKLTSKVITCSQVFTSITFTRFCNRDMHRHAICRAAPLDALCMRAMQVKFEPAAPVGDRAAKPSDERKWPHLYGTIDFHAVEQRLPVRRDTEGRFLEVMQ